MPTDDPLYLMLRQGDFDNFNKRIQSGENVDLSHCNFSRLDLRGLNADGLDLSHGYFRLSNLAGIDFSKAKLEGASFKHANISGALFPSELSAKELLLSVEHGTRVRYRSI